MTSSVEEEEEEEEEADDAALSGVRGASTSAKLNLEFFLRKVRAVRSRQFRAAATSLSNCAGFKGWDEGIGVNRCVRGCIHPFVC